MFFNLLIASRYIFSKKREGFISIIAWFSLIGISLGVATLIVVMSVMNGFREELFGALVSMRGHVSIYAVGQLIDEDFEQLRAVQSIPGVRFAYPMLEQQAICMANEKAQGVMIQGLTIDGILKRGRIQITDGKSEQPYNNKSVTAVFQAGHVFLGRRLAENLNLKIGDTINILTPKSTTTAFGSLPRQKSFKVSGIFHVGMHDFDKNFIFMPIKDAQNLFKAEHKWSQIDVFSADDRLTTYLTDIVQKALDVNGAEKPYRAFDWRHSDSAIFYAVKMERNVMFLILTLIILIASFNIITGLTMLVKDKIKDIAILRTIGASKRSILIIFILTGSFIGFVGTSLGLGLGLSFALNIENIRVFLQGLTGVHLFAEEIYFLSTLPSKVDMSEITMIVIMSLILSLLATIYPALKAAWLDPVEGLKSIG